MAKDKVVFETERENGEMLRATISEFKGNTMISVRCFYEKSKGEFAPGRNGINIYEEEADAFLEAVTALHKEVTGTE